MNIDHCLFIDRDALSLEISFQFMEDLNYVPRAEDLIESAWRVWREELHDSVPVHTLVRRKELQAVLQQALQGSAVQRLQMPLFLGCPTLSGVAIFRGDHATQDWQVTVSGTERDVRAWKTHWLEVFLSAQLERQNALNRFHPAQVEAIVHNVRQNPSKYHTFQLAHFPEHSVARTQTPFRILSSHKRGEVFAIISDITPFEDPAYCEHFLSEAEWTVMELMTRRGAKQGVFFEQRIIARLQKEMWSEKRLGIDLPFIILLGLADTTSVDLSDCRLLQVDSDPSISNWQEQQQRLIDHAKTALNRLPAKGQFLSSITFCANEETLADIRSDIRTLRYHFFRVCQRGSSDKRDYVLAHQLFPFTRHSRYVEWPVNNLRRQELNDLPSAKPTWLPTVVREMVALQGFHPDPAWIRLALRIPTRLRHCEEVLAHLVESGLLIENVDGKLVRTTENFRAHEHMAQSDLFACERGMLDAAASSLQFEDLEHSDFGSLALSVFAEDLPELQNAILGFCERILAHSEDVVKPLWVMQLNLQLFGNPELLKPDQETIIPQYRND